MPSRRASAGQASGPDSNAGIAAKRSRQDAPLRQVPPGGAQERLTEQARLLDLSNDAIVVRDAHDRITYWSQGAEIEYGFTADEALGKVCHELLKTEFSLPLASISLVLDRTGSWSGELIHTRKDGSKGTYLSRWMLDRDAAGRRRTVLEANTNVDEQEQAQAAGARLAAIIESSDDAIIGEDFDGVITSWNQSAQRMFGYAAEEAIGLSIEILVPEDHRGQVEGLLARIKRGERISHIETKRRHKDGSLLDVSLTVSPIRDRRGRIVGASKIARDITSRKRSEQALIQSESRLRAVLETAIDAIVTIDERGRIQSVNAATTRMFGCSVEELVGRNVKTLMPSPYQAEHDAYLQRYLKTGEKRIIGVGREVQARRKDGSVFPVDLAVSEVEPGKLFTGIIRDISERKTSEMRLRDADRMASIGALAAGLGHDMNNVLLPVRAHLNVLWATKEAPPNQSALEQIQAGITYLQQLADGLHFLAMDPDKEDDAGGLTDLHEWWRQTGALLRKAVPKHVKVVTSIPAGLPKVTVPAHALTQAVLNLIVNAGEAIPAERRRRQGYVRLTAQRGLKEDSVALSIADNGSGMTDEVKRRAFDMFFTTKPRGLGTGLGLAMVRKVVDRAGGTIEIESTLDEGTTIKLLLPAVAEEKSQERRIAAIRLSDGRAASLIRNLLEISGARIDGGDAGEADVFVTEPAEANLKEATAWRKRRPHGRLVLFGSPGAGQSDMWNEFGPVIIDDPANLESVRDAIGVALSDR